MSKKIIISAGGSGGHVFPALALAKDLKRESELLFVGGDLSKNNYFDKSYNYLDLSTSPLTKTSLRVFFKSLLKITKGFFQGLKIIKKFKPDCIIAFGSFHTFPLLCAAKVLRVPIYLHEQNIVMGKVNHTFAKSAKVVLTAYPLTSSYFKTKSVQTKMPLRFGSVNMPSQSQALNSLGLDQNRKTILIFGGSQGALFINKIFLKALPELNEDFQVIHMVGKHQEVEPVELIYQRYEKKCYVKVFDKNMHTLLRACDFVISRAGASTISELIELEKPALLIPYPYAKAHQEKNAEFYQTVVGGGVMMLQSELNKNLLSKLIINFLQDNTLKEYKDKITRYKEKDKSLDIIDYLRKELNYGRN